MFGVRKLFLTTCLLLGSPIMAVLASADEPVFPKPDPAGTYGEMKLPTPQGQVWRAPVEDWAGARQRIAEDPAWAAWFQEQRTTIDDWMARRSDRVEWVAGWWHEFISPKDGSFLIWTPEIPGEEVATLASASDPVVEVTPTLFRSWVVSFRGRHLSMVQNTAILARLTGEPKYKEWVAGQLDFYAENLKNWPVQDRFYGPSQLMGQPLMDAINIAKLVDSARLIWDEVEPARRQYWFDHLFEPEAELLNQSMLRYHNIACWLRSASAQIAMLYDDQPLWAFAVDGPWGLRRQIENGVTGDYLWYEQSSGYNQFTVMALTPFFVSAGLQGRAADFAREMAITQNMALAPTWMRFPDNSMPNPADTTVNYPHHAPLRKLLQRIYRFAPTPIGLNEAAMEKSWETLLDPPATRAVEGPLPEVRSHNYESSRFGVMRSGGWQVFFHYGQLTGSHAQAEALNFEAHYGQIDVTHDAFTVGYASPMHREYFTRGLAHNVPLLNGEGSEKPALDGNPLELPQRGELLAYNADLALMAAAQPAYRADAQAQRSLRIEGRKLIDEVTLTASGEIPQELGLALHVQGTVKAPDAMQPVADFAAGRPESFGYWQEVQAGTFRDTADFAVTYPDGLKLNVVFSLPGEFRVYLASTPDSPVPERRTSFYLETKGTTAKFKTEFIPMEAAARKEKQDQP